MPVFNQYSINKEQTRYLLINLLSQAITFGLSLFVARLYKTFLFGEYSTIVAIAAVLSPFLTLTKELEIVPSRSDKLAKENTQNAIDTLSANSFYILTVSAALNVINLFGLLPIPRSWILMLNFASILSCVNGVFTILNQSLLKNKQFRILGRRLLIQCLGIGLFQIFFLKIGMSTHGLIIGEIFGRAIAITVLTRKNTDSVQFRLFKNLKLQNFKSRISIYNTSAILLEYFSSSLAMIFVATKFGSSEAGIFAMWQKIFYAPTALVGIVVAQLVLTETASRIRDGERNSRKLFTKTLKFLAITGISLSVIFYFFSRHLVIKFLGQNWQEVGSILKVTSLLVAVSFIWSPMSSFFYSLHLWKQFFLFSIIRFGLTLVSISITIADSLNTREFILLLTTAVSVLQVCGLFYLSRKSTVQI